VRITELSDQLATRSQPILKRRDNHAVLPVWATLGSRRRGDASPDQFCDDGGAIQSLESTASACEMTEGVFLL